MSSTFRVKIGLAAAGIVIALFVVMYLVTVLPLSRAAEEGVRKSVQRASGLVTRSQQLHGYDLLALAQDVASREEFFNGVQTEPEDKRRVNVFDAINEYDKKLQGEGRKAHFFGVVDKTGSVVARDLDINNMYGEKLRFQNISRALKGEASKDIWRMKNSMMRAAAAPVSAHGKVIGAVAIAYDFTAKEAREERDQFGTDVAYFMDTIRASSLSLPNEDATEDAQKVAALNRALFASPTSPGAAALAQDKTTDIMEVDLQGETYLAIAGPLPARLTHMNAGYVVLASLDAALAPVDRVRWMFFILGLASLVFVLGGMWVVARHFVNEEDKLELAVNEVINGNLEYSFEDVHEFEGLANAINVMLARLLGRPEPGEEEDGEASWRADVLSIEDVTGDYSGEAQRAAALANEPEESYYVRTYQEYVTARSRLNLSVEGITLESMTQKLKANEGLLKAKYKCRAVRFQVQDKMGKVTLKPIRIN